MKRGLVLEGGAMRGMYSAGVIDVLMENGVEFDGAVGVSAGAAFGCNYKSRQIGRTIRYNKRFCNDKRYVGIGSLLKTGDLYNAEFAYHEVPFVHDVFDEKTFRENPMEFYVVCTDVDTGKPVYHRLDTGDQGDVDWIRASASMPVVSRAVELDGLRLLDGGISDSIPIEWFRSIGYERNLIVLTRPEGYRKKPSSGKLFDLLLRKQPRIAEAMRNRSIMYNNTLDVIEKLCTEGETLAIRPSVDMHMKRVEKDPEKLEELYQLGRADAAEQLERIKAFLAH